MDRKEAIENTELMIVQDKLLGEDSPIARLPNMQFLAIKTLLSTTRQVEDGVEIIITKRDWSDLLRGGCHPTLRLFRENELHYEFGDCSEENVVRVKVILLTEEE